MSLRWTICPDCGSRYAVGAPHFAFCVHHTCEECLTGFVKKIRPGPDGRRVCRECLGNEARYRARQIKELAGKARELEWEVTHLKHVNARLHEKLKPKIATAGDRHFDFEE